MTATVLILTHSGDFFTVDRVADAVAARGAQAVRLDTDLFPSRVLLSSHLASDESRHVLRIGDDEVTTDGIEAVWARRTWTPRIDDGVDPELREGCIRESQAALRGFLDSLHAARWINPPGAQREAEDKLRQLRIADGLGLSIPRTLVTNDPAAARDLYDRLDGRIVAKMLTPLTQSMGRAPAFVHTSPVSADDLEHLDSLRLSPMVFQEAVPKERELRVTCVGSRLFIGAMDASSSREGRDDWRRAGADEVAWEHGSVPDDVAARLCELVRRLGLVYGAVDLIRTPAGEHVFLEINPGGEWGMLERDLGLPIADALAEALLTPREQAR